MKFDRSSGQARPVSGLKAHEEDTGFSLKHILLLTVAVFLIAAPAPDPSDVKEMTANFIVPVNHADFPALKSGE